MTVSIPESHRDLLEGPVVVTLATIMSGDQPHTTAIWCDYDGTQVSFVTSRGVQKEKNLQRQPQVSLMALDMQNPYRYVEIRGVVESITEEGAMDKLNALTQLYTGKPSYYGHIVPAEDEGKSTHVICTITPTKVVIMG